MTSTPAAFGCRPSRCKPAEIGGNAVKEERIQRKAEFGGSIRINALERRRIIGSQIRRRAHAAQEHGDMPLLQSLQNCVNGRARHRGLYSAQHIVGADFQDHRIGVVRHRPIEPRQGIRGGVAGDAGIDHGRGEPLCGQRRLQPRHKAFALRQAEAGRQRVAERHDLDRLGRRFRHPPARLGSQDERKEKRNATNSRTHDVAQYDMAQYFAATI